MAYRHPDVDLGLFLERRIGEARVTEFHTTQWSLVNQAAYEGTMRRDALQELLTRYMPALRAHLVRRKRLAPETADELLQGFILKNILEGELIQRADQKAGRFRGWLLRWLDMYVRHELSRNRREMAVEQMDEQANHAATDAFEIEWARATLQETLRNMQKQCEASGNRERWQVFDCRLVRPLLSDAEPMDYAELVRTLGLKSNAQVQNIMVTAKRQFERTLETVIGRYVLSKDDITAEIMELRRILATAKSVEPDDESVALPAAAPMASMAALPSIAASTRAAEARPDQVVKFLDLDCAQVWQRCLATPVADLLSGNSPDQVRESSAMKTLADLLHHPQAAEESLLRELKQFGNSSLQQKSAEISCEVGLAIYLVAIATASVHLGVRISQSPAEVLSSGLQWLLETEWIDLNSREIIDRARIALVSKTTALS